jgi:hypothetical protein
MQMCMVQRTFGCQQRSLLGSVGLRQGASCKTVLLILCSNHAMTATQII